jgi:poly(3-hydroxybutyrate) depolymerase
MSAYAPSSVIAVRSLGCAFALVWTFACGGKNEDAEVVVPIGQSGSAAVAAGSGGSLPATPAAVGGSGAALASPAGQGGVGSTAGAAQSASGSAGAVAGASGVGGAPTPAAPAGAAIDALKAHLAMPRAQRPALEMQAFAKTPLSRAEAAQARELLWNDFAADVRETRMGEMGATESRAASVQIAGKTMRYYAATRGAKPAGGRSLFISMHGGGNAPAATNDSQWQNQIALCDQYMPKDAIWIAPRAPSDDWNMWFTPDVDGFFARLVTNFIVFEGIDPNKVYIGGYSAGGDGVYQLGPRMADHWAGAAMSAGHPNDASPLNLRNLPFAIHVGGNDTAYDRNLKAMEWGKKLEELRTADPDGYLNQWQVHAGKPHWMDLEDRVAIPFVQMQTRNPVPSKVVWQQADVLQPRFYWVAVDPASVKKGALVRATYANAVITFEEVSGVSQITVRVSDAMSNLDQPLRVMSAGKELFSGPVPRTIGVLARTLAERGDPAMMFDGEASVTLN